MSKSKKTHVTVTQESDTGRNKKFIDNKTGNEMTRAQFAKKIDAGEYPDYHVKNIHGLRTPVSNPNGNEGDNLG